VPRAAFDRQLGELQDEVLVLGSMVDKAIDAAVDALKRRDLEKSKEIVDADRAINQKRYEIEERCLLVIATQQPLASDLRAIAAMLSIVTDLERMADHAEGIAKISLMIGEQPLLKPLVDTPRMAEIGRAMLRQALEAFVNRDLEAAKRVAAMDDQVDELYNQVYNELLTFMISDPRTITRATHLLWVAHNLERIADRVTNICERVAFMVNGRMEDMNVSSY